MTSIQKNILTFLFFNFSVFVLRPMFDNLNTPSTFQDKKVETFKKHPLAKIQSIELKRSISSENPAKNE